MIIYISSWHPEKWYIQLDSFHNCSQTHQFHFQLNKLRSKLSNVKMQNNEREEMN